MHDAGLINWKTFIASEMAEIFIFPFPPGAWNDAHFKHNFSIIFFYREKLFMPAFHNLNLFVLSRVGDFAMKAAKAVAVDGYDCFDSRYWISTMTGCKMYVEIFNLKSAMKRLSPMKACKVWRTTAPLEETFKKEFGGTFAGTSRS